MQLIPPETLLYVDDISPSQEKTKDEIKKIVVIHFVLRPFTFEQAQLMGVERRLFGADDKPLEDVESSTLTLKNLPLYILSWGMAPGTVGMKLDHVKVHPSVAFRRHKEGASVFSAKFSASVIYPAADDLLKILHAYTENRYVSFDAQPSLPLERGDVEGDAIKRGDELRPGIHAE